MNKKLTKEMESDLNGLVGIIERCKCAYPELREDYIDMLRNNLELLKDYDVHKYEEKLKQYENQ